MPKKISIIDMRGWLDSYEQGKSEADIASDAHRDVRTVKRGIEEARRERYAHTAKAELLKEALRNHHKALVGALDRLKDDIRLPAPDLQVQWEEDAPPMSPAMDITQYEERQPLLELLREHLMRDALWDALDRWKKSLAVHLRDRMALKRKAATLLQEKTGLKLSDKPIEGPFLYSYTALNLVYEETLRRALGISRMKDPEKDINVSPDGQVRYGAGNVLAEAPPRKEECRRGIIEAFSELGASPESGRAAATYREAETNAARARQLVEEISLLGLMPGTCRICRRLGM